MEERDREYKKAIDYLCGLVSEGTLQIGGRLPAERTIAETLAISRNSTREALRTLENRGVIESRRGSGNYLTGNISKTITGALQMMLLLGRTDREEICAFRRSMEKAVCLAVMERPDADWTAAAELLTDKPGRTADEELEADRQFHYLLIRATGNRIWIELMDAISDIYRGWIDAVLRRADDALREELRAAHRAVLDALWDGDRQRCEAAVDRHYDLCDRELRREERDAKAAEK